MIKPGLTLIRRGDPDFALRLKHSPSATEEFAAEQIRDHLLAMAGMESRQYNAKDATTGICINDRDAAALAGIEVEALALGPDDFHLETRGGNVHVLGGGPRGVVYGAYHLLEALGCRWYAASNTVVPRRRTVVLPPLKVTQRPAFEFRDTFNWDLREPKTWLRHRLNGWYCPVPSYMGGHIDYGGFVHTFHELLPPGEFFETHPEYYSLVNGTRRRDAAQLCLTHPEVVRIVTERVLERMRRQPALTIFSVSQNDCANPCECPACRAIVEEEAAQSGPILRFVNAVAAETSKVFPDKLIDTLAYWYSVDAPKHVVPHPNVRVRLCSIGCCQVHGYGACDHPASRQFLRALDDWSKITPQLYIWHYATNFAHYLLPMPDLEELQANLRLYRDRGVRGVFIQSCGDEGGGAESLALRGYVTSRLLWNPDLPLWALVDEFLRAHYGVQAAPGVRQYLEVLHDRVRRDKTLHYTLFDPPPHPLFNAETLAQADRPLAAAESLAHGKARLRVKLLRHGLRYPQLATAGGTFRRDGDRYHGEAAPEQLRQFEALVRDCRKAGMRHLREFAPLPFTAQIIRGRLQEHRVEWLRDATQEIAIVPTLAGRILEWQASGRQWLAMPVPDEHGNADPLLEGYRENVTVGLYGTSGWAECYRCTRRGESLILRASLAHDLRLERRLALREGTLHIDSRLTNSGGSIQRCRWGGSLHLSATGGTTSFTAKDGTAVSVAWDALPEGFAEAPSWQGEQLPAGAWGVTLGNHRLTQQFEGPVAVAIVGRTTAVGLLALDLLTDFVDLAPNNTLTIHQAMSVLPG